MASAQVSVTAEMYYEQNKGAVDGAMKQAQSMICEKGKCIQCSDAAVGVNIRNNTKGQFIQLLQKKEWSGRVLVPFPHTIPRFRPGKFVHVSRKCDKAAVVYAGSNIPGNGQQNCAWLVVWSVPNDGCSENKVYVEAGKIGDYIEMDWDAIEQKMNDSEHYAPTSYYQDESTGCEAFAMITPGKHAAVAVDFNNTTN